MSATRLRSPQRQGSAAEHDDPFNTDDLDTVMDSEAADEGAMAVDPPYLKRRRSRPNLLDSPSIHPNGQGLATYGGALPDLHLPPPMSLSPQQPPHSPSPSTPPSPRAGQSTTSSLTSAGASPPPTRQRRCDSVDSQLSGEEDAAGSGPPSGPCPSSDSSLLLALSEGGSARGGSPNSADLEAAIPRVLHEGELRQVQENKLAALTSLTSTDGESPRVTASRLAADDIADADRWTAHQQAIATEEYYARDHDAFAALRQPPSSSAGSSVGTGPSTAPGSDSVPAESSAFAQLEPTPTIRPQPQDL